MTTHLPDDSDVIIIKKSEAVALRRVLFSALRLLEEEMGLPEDKRLALTRKERRALTK